MTDKIEKRMKLNKWYIWIPVLGAMIYSVMVEMAINTIVLKDKRNKKLKIIKKYKLYMNLTSLAIAIPFVVLFFVYRNKGDFGSWPWFFWVGLSIGLGTNLTPLLSYWAYDFGLKKYKNAK